MEFWHVIITRSIFSFFYLLLIARLLGKKQVSQLTFFDYIVGITIGSIASTLAVEIENSTLNAVIGMLIYGILAFLLSFLSVKFNWVSKLLDGEPTVLIEKGKILEKNLARSRLTVDELIALLREKNAFNLADVEYAVLETNGGLSVQKKAAKESLTPGDIGLQTPYKGKPKIIIQGGQLIMHRLRELGLTRAWVKEKLANQGVYDVKEVFAAQVDNAGKIYVDTYADFPGGTEPDTFNRQMLTSLSSLAANMESYALETDNEQVKAMYENCRQKLTGIAEEFKPYVEREIIQEGELHED